MDILRKFPDPPVSSLKKDDPNDDEDVRAAIAYVLSREKIEEYEQKAEKFLESSWVADWSDSYGRSSTTTTTRHHKFDNDKNTRQRTLRRPLLLCLLAARQTNDVWRSRKKARW